MKTTKLFVAISVTLFVVVVIAPFVVMTGYSKYQERTAENDCAKFIIGMIYNKSVINKTAIYKNDSEFSYYSYLYPLSFDDAAECKIYIDDKNKIVKKGFIIR